MCVWVCLEGGGSLTAVSVLLQLAGDAGSCVVEVEVQTELQEVRVLLDVLGDLHLDFVTQHLRPLWVNIGGVNIGGGSGRGQCVRVLL